MLAGSSLLQCLAILEQPVARGDNTRWLSMDGVVLFATQKGKDNNICCHFNYLPAKSSEVIKPGKYSVLAMVCPIKFILICSSFYLTLFVDNAKTYWRGSEQR